MSEPEHETDTPEVPIQCPECETTSRVPLPALADQLETHNENVHGGEEIARVDPDVADHLADLVASELGLLDTGE
jgi:hypothetical protein